MGHRVASFLPQSARGATVPEWTRRLEINLFIKIISTASRDNDGLAVRLLPFPREAQV